MGHAADATVEANVTIAIESQQTADRENLFMFFDLDWGGGWSSRVCCRRWHVIKVQSIDSIEGSASYFQ